MDELKETDGYNYLKKGDGDNKCISANDLVCPFFGVEYMCTPSIWYLMDRIEWCKLSKVICVTWFGI